MKEKNENLRICNYIIINTIKLLKKEKIKKVNVLLLSNLINIELDNDIYIISNMISYKKFIDNISFNYKELLKYIPRDNNKNIIESIKYVYNKYNQVNIELYENSCLN